MENKEEPSENDQLFPKATASTKSTEVRETQVISLQDAYTKSGGLGRLQAYILTMTIFQVIGPSLLMSNLVYFELKPKNYICHYTDGSMPCNLDEVCRNSDPRFINWEIDQSVPYLKNIITDFGMICESKFGIGLIGSMYFIGEAVGSLIYIVFSKNLKQTRIRHLYMRNFMLMLILGMLITLVRSTKLLYISIFAIGLCQSISIVQGFAYTMELMPFERRNLISMLLHLIDKVLLTITTISLKYYGSDWIMIMIPGFFCAVVASIMSIFAIDSPQFHHDLGNYNKCRQIFATIAVWNGATPMEKFIFEKEPIHYQKSSYQSTNNDIELKEEGKQSTLNNQTAANSGNEVVEDNSLFSNFDPRQIFETKIEYYQFLLVIIVLSTCVMDDNILHYSLKSYEGDIYNNHIILMISGSVAIYLAYFLIKNFHPAISLAFSFMIMCTAGFIYPSIHNLRAIPTSLYQPSIETSATFLLCLAKLGTGTAHNLTNLFILWQFNSKNYSYVFASANLFARVFAILAPEIGELKEPVPMFVVAFTSAACGFLCFLLFVHLEKNKARPKSDHSHNLKEMEA